MLTKHRRADEGMSPAGIARPAMIALAIFALALGIFAWRAVSVFTMPPPPAAAATELGQLAETIVGPGQVRVAKADNGAIIFLVDGPPGELSRADVVKLRELATLLHPNSAPASVRQYPFAVGTPAQPTREALLELAAMTILLGLSGFFALMLTQNSRTRSAMQSEPANPQERRSSDDSTPAARASRRPSRIVTKPRHSIETATELAQRDPKLTAAIIRKWLQQQESTA